MNHPGHHDQPYQEHHVYQNMPQPLAAAGSAPQQMRINSSELLTPPPSSANTSNSNNASGEALEVNINGNGGPVDEDEGTVVRDGLDGVEDEVHNIPTGSTVSSKKDNEDDGKSRVFQSC